MGHLVIDQDAKKACCRIEINGIVQGVGFRPFIYRLAHKYNLNGYVINNTNGVLIEVEGTENNTDRFIEEVKQNPPELAEIYALSKTSLPLKGFHHFEICESKVDPQISTSISPDIAVCDDCLRELFDPSDRRYLYPFINCTNCGPRYTIIQHLPYDRESTTMSSFQMCPDCKKEYSDPLDRRFHAQPDACHVCGPSVQLTDFTGISIKCSDPIKKTTELLKKGRIAAIKGLGGFHLACDAENDDAVCRLRKRKNREEKPLAVMVWDISVAKTLADISECEEKLLTSNKRPIVLLRKKQPSPLSSHIAPNNKFLGIMLPYTPLHYLLFNSTLIALVMTSGNISEEPIAVDNDEALKKLAGIAEYFLLHNREIYINNDDSVYRTFRNRPFPIRRSRGYAPAPVLLKNNYPNTLGCGADLKNTICFLTKNKAFLSQHIGDLSNVPAMASYEKSIGHLQKLLDIKPDIAACDLHPDYYSTRFAGENLECPVCKVQHHHAHIAACMAENNLDTEVIGISLDGTGYGTDGKIWGGEILFATLRDFERKAHLAYVPMPGGEKAIKEPWRMAVSYLYHTFKDDFRNMNFRFLQELDSCTIDLTLQAIKKNINTPMTSSCGRLFDAAAALIGLRNSVSFEGQAAMQLENLIPTGVLYNGDKKDCYGFDITNCGGIHEISMQECIRAFVMDVMSGKNNKTISTKFHNTLIELLRELCIILREERNINSVALSGGCFQNMYLLTQLTNTLKKAGFSVYCHSKVPANDGGISLGQAVIAANNYLQTR